MKRKSIKTLFLLCVLVLSIFAIDKIFNLDFTTKAVTYISPVGVVFSDVGSDVTSFFGNITKIGSLQKENKNLDDRLNNALAEISRLSASQKENESLKNDLNFMKSHDFTLLGARIIFFDPSNIRETVTIDVGKIEGTEVGNPVLSQGFLIGKIKSTTDHTARVVLITDPESATPAMIVNKNITGIIRGKIGNGLTLDQVPQSDKVGKDDLISTSGLGGEFPKGLLIGKIENVQRVSGSIFQAIEVNTMIDLNKLERVMIIKG
jgi:rod shape-determining protein MreC